MENVLGKVIFDISQGKRVYTVSSWLTTAIKLINNHNSQVFADITEDITDDERQIRSIYVYY